MKKLDFKHQEHLPILFNNALHSKALEPVCLFRPLLSPIVIPIFRGEGWGEGSVCFGNQLLQN